MGAKDEDRGFGLFMLALLAANAIPTIAIYNVLWWTGAAQRDMAQHCDERGEVVAHALLLTWGLWVITALIVIALKAKTLGSLILRSTLLALSLCVLYRGFF